MNDKTQKSSSLGTVGFMIAAIIFAAIAGILLSQVMESTYSQEPVKPVVVAAKVVPAGRPMHKEDFKVANWPESSIPQGAYTKVKQVADNTRVPLIPFVPGEAVLKSHLSKPHAGLGIAPLIDPDKRAMSLSTDDSVTLSRLLYPGARVDILATIRETWDRGEGRPKVSTKIVLQNIKVLAVGEDIDPLTIDRRRRARAAEKEGAMDSSNQGDSREVRAVVTLLVSPEEAERLALARREGKIDFVLRNPKDTKTVETPGATPLAFVPMDPLMQFEGEDLGGSSEGSGVDRAGAARAARASTRSRRRRRPRRSDDNPKRARSLGGSHGVVIIK